ncbi:MAG: hypothetical protein ACTSR5_16165 [Promethearchaeota archaeon]
MINIKYKRNQYSEGFSICSLIFAGMFFYWSYELLTKSLLNWLGYLWLGIGIAIVGSQITALVNRSKLRNVVSHEFMVNPNVSVEEISAITGISVKDIRAIILDLKADGRLRGKFSTSTGKAKSMEVIQPKPVQVSEPPVEGNNLYCPNCAYCGSKL